MFKNSKPCVYADINKKTRDLLMDDYFNGSKLTMKIKKVQPLNITLEARALDGKPIVSKISGDIKPCDYCKIKKVSIDSTGVVIGDVDIEKVLNHTTFMIRTMKDLNENGFKKAEIGAKVITKNIAVNGSFDCMTTKYSADMVYAYKSVLAGLRVFGKGMNTPSCDASLSFPVNKQLMIGCSLNNLMESVGVSLHYKLCKEVKMGLSGQAQIGSGARPEVTFGLKYKPSKKTVIRGKINEKGLMSAVIKTEVDKKITFSGCIMADVLDFTSSNRASVGVELVF